MKIDEAYDEWAAGYEGQENKTRDLDAAMANGFTLERFSEGWHAEDEDKPPRLATFLFEHEDHSQEPCGEEK